MEKKALFVLLLIVLVAGCVQAPVKDNNAQIANPASVNCVEKGGRLEIRENEQGQYGVCIFDTFECDEWAFYRGECPTKEECNVSADCDKCGNGCIPLSQSIKSDCNEPTEDFDCICENGGCKRAEKTAGCNEDNDCISEVEVKPQCSHYCKPGECKETTRFCNFYSVYSEEAKNKKDLQCIWNEPCKKPDTVKCINNECQVSKETLGKECSIDGDCVKGGCSGTICQSKNAEPIVTTCEYLPEYACYKDINCGCVEGKCQWNKTGDFNRCLEEKRNSDGEVVV